MATVEELKAKIEKARQDRSDAEAKTIADLAVADEAVQVAILEQELALMGVDALASMSDDAVLPGRDKNSRVTPPASPAPTSDVVAGGNK